MSFNSVVAEWLAARKVDVAEVVAVTTFGTDWEGDTESGFYSSADVEITYLTPDGERRYFKAVGKDLGDLWHHVVKSWPV